MGGGGYFQGRLDEVRVWNVARSNRELEANRHTRLVGDEPGLVAYWRMDELAEFGPKDSSRFGNHAWTVGGVEQVPSGVPLFAELPPLAFLLEPQDVGDQVALLRGRVNPRGLPTTAWFEHGWGTNFEFALPSQVVPAGVGEALVSAPLTGLLPGLERRIRLLATNSLGRMVSETLVHKAPSPAGQAVALDGVQDYLTTPFVGAWFVDETVTFELWFNAEGPGVLVTERGQPLPADNWQISLLELLDTGELRARVHQVPEFSVGTVRFGLWYHVALRYDRTRQRLDGFLDGVKVPAFSIGDRAAPGESGLPVLWGFGLAESAHMGSGRAFRGAFDEIRIWNTARSDEEIQREFDLRLTGQEPGLVLYWPCDDRGGGMVHDATGHENQAQTSLPPVFIESSAGGGLPAAVTGQPTVAAADRSSLSGTVVRSRTPGIAYFEWGADPHYEAQTEPQPVPGDARDQSVQATIEGLLPGTVYHARLVVENSEGVGYGEDRSFETPGQGEGRALELDGLGGALTTPDLASAFASESVTFELWFRARGPGVLLTERDQFGAAPGWQVSLLEVAPTGEVLARGYEVGSLSLGRVSFEEWHHVALRYDEERLRLDGVLDGNLSRIFVTGDRRAPWEPRSAWQTPYPARYGFGMEDRTGLSTSAWFAGQLDEIRIWDRALTLSEIRDGLGRRLLGSEPGLVGYWRCDEPMHAMVRDSSGHGHGAKLVGGVGRVDSGIWQGFPWVATLSATEVGQTSATPQGWVHTGESVAAACFEWGKSDEYGHRTAWQEIRQGAGSVVVSAVLSNLDPSTTYHYRLVAVGEGQTRLGADRTFLTSGTGGVQSAALFGQNAFLFSEDLTDAFRDETLTLELWFKAAGPGTLVSEVTQYLPEASWQTELMELQPNGELWVRVQGLNPVRLGVIEFDRWHHAVLRYDKPSLRLDGFLDGTLSDSVATGDRQALWESGQQTRLGFGLDPTGRLPGLTGGFQGLMDELRLWNRALSATEVRANARLPLSGGEPGLVGYWRCDEGAGQHLGDASGNGNDLLAWSGANWQASDAPVNAWGVTTFEASEVTTSTAILNARIVTGAAAADAWFEWGPTPGLGRLTEARSLVGGSGFATLEVRIEGLAPASRYYYAPVAARGGMRHTGELRRFDTPGDQAGRAVRLDGANDYILTRDLRAAFPTDSLTIELWFKAERGGVLADERDGLDPQSGWFLSLLEVLPDGDVRARVNLVPPVSLGRATFDEWHHVALRYDHVSRRLDGFFDGVRSTTVSTGDRSSPGENGLGAHYGFGLANRAHMGSGLHFRGLLDEIRIWHVARDAEEILRDMTQPLSGREPGLVCYFRLDEGVGSLTADGSGLGGPGHLLNQPAWVDSTAPLFRLIPITRRSDGQIELAFRAVPRQDYLLESSADLIRWMAIQTNTAGLWGHLRFLDPAPAGDVHRFYRVGAP